MNGKPLWMLPGWIYVYRTRKPGALLGLPLIGRHNGYTGQTRNPKMRHIEHTEGGGRYNKPRANWSDLDPKRYLVFYLPMCPKWLLNLMELVAILVTWPVYNDRMNRWNPRRIPLKVAARQREIRDRSGVRWIPHLNAGHLIGILVILGLVAWGWW